MTFLSPLWLLGLLPWAMLVYWLLQRRRRPTEVPFVDLWRGPFHPPKPTRQFDRPPLALALVMLAIGSAILAAAGPAVKDTSGRGGSPIPVVVDRGAGMSAGEPRFASSLRELQQALTNAGVGAQRKVDLHLVPGAGAIASDVRDLTQRRPRTAADTRAAVAATASRLLNETGGPVVVVSDQPLGITDERLIQVPPPDVQFRNAGIARVAARPGAMPQVMVTVGVQAWSKPVRIVVASDGAETASTIEPPADGQTRDTFIGVQRLGPTVEVRLDGVTDDASADDRAWLVRQESRPKVEAQTALSPELRRLVESYGATRPPGDGATRVAIVNDPSKAAGTPAVILPGQRDGKAKPGEVTVSPHPVTRDADFGAIGDATVVTDPPAGWTAVVRRGGDVWVAVRETPARQVWVGFDAPEWARSPGYVVFWAAVFDWIGGGGEQTFTASEMGSGAGLVNRSAANDDETDNPWWPGLHRNPDGTARAVNSGWVRPGTVAVTDWRTRLPVFQGGGQHLLSPYVLLAALGCLVVASAVWKRPSLTEISGKTTVATDGVLTEARAARADAMSRPITAKQDT